MEKSLKVKVPFIDYVDLESLLEKISTCHNNLEKSSTPKIKEHTPSGYSLFIHCSFDTTKNKTDYYRGKNCMQNFCLDLRQHATKSKSEIIKVRNHCHNTGKYRGASHDICNLRYKTPK